MLRGPESEYVEPVLGSLLPPHSLVRFAACLCAYQRGLTGLSRVSRHNQGGGPCHDKQKDVARAIGIYSMLGVH
jgi:hypothetical protein